VLLPPQRRRSLFDYKIVAAYLAGTSSGALLTVLAGWVLSGFAEPLSGVVRTVLLIAGALFVWMCKHGPLEHLVMLPEARRQIPAEVFGGSLIRGAYRFGFALGTGMRTYVPSPAPYVLLLAIVLGQLTLGNALLVGVGYGLGRAAPLIVQLFAATQIRSSSAFLRGADSLVSTAASLCVLAGALSLV
jgi:hypothetical protein